MLTKEYSLDSSGGPVAAVDAGGAADTEAEAEAESTLVAMELPERMVETDPTATLVCPLKIAEEADMGAEDATPVRTEDTASLADAAADDAVTAEESSLDDCASAMAARRRAHRAERRALRTTIAALTSGEGGLGEISEAGPWVYIPH